MAPATIPSTEPETVVAGLTWRWDKALADYRPADGWALKYVCRGAGQIDLTGAATSDGGGWELTASATATGDLLPGVYLWTSYVESGSEKYPVGSGTLTVLPNPITASEGQLQPFAEQALAHVEASLLKRYQQDISAYTIEQRQTQREEIEKLEAARARLLAELDKKKGRGILARRVEWRPKAYR